MNEVKKSIQGLDEKSAMNSYVLEISWILEIKSSINLTKN
jgi:hypothetical protein